MGNISSTHWLSINWTLAKAWSSHVKRKTSLPRQAPSSVVCASPEVKVASSANVSVRHANPLAEALFDTMEVTSLFQWSSSLNWTIPTPAIFSFKIEQVKCFCIYESYRSAENAVYWGMSYTRQSWRARSQVTDWEHILHLFIYLSVYLSILKAVPKHEKKYCRQAKWSGSIRRVNDTLSRRLLTHSLTNCFHPSSGCKHSLNDNMSPSVHTAIHLRPAWQHSDRAPQPVSP